LRAGNIVPQVISHRGEAEAPLVVLAEHTDRRQRAHQAVERHWIVRGRFVPAGAARVMKPIAVNPDTVAATTGTSGNRVSRCADITPTNFRPPDCSGPRKPKIASMVA
jgi:hypothetical protein